LSQTPKKNETFRTSLDEWGWEIQSLVLIEEMAEVTQAIIKIHRQIFFQNRGEGVGFIDLTKFVKEMADLKLMFDQIKYDFTPEELNLFQKEYGSKLAKIRDKLAEMN